MRGKPLSIHIIRGISTTSASHKKARLMLKELRTKSNCDRALEHFDDFYGSFFGKRKWPALRLGLLCPPKYVAIPNPFTGNIDKISQNLEGMGAFNIHNFWEESKVKLAQLQKQLDLKKDMGRIHSLEKTLESIAMTKKAEELELLYQNSSDKKTGLERAEFLTGSGGGGSLYGKPQSEKDNQRLFSHHSEPAFVPPSRLKGVDDFAFDSEYYAGFLPGSLHAVLDPQDDHPFVYTNPRKTLPLKWPVVFKPFTFEPGSSEEFPSSSSSSGLRDYICVNGGSIVPIIALDLNPGVDLLDLCAGPGTKSLMALMTMSINSITCNDLDQSRIYRVKKILQEFIGSETPDSVTYTRLNANDYPTDRKFHRVLADVPCLNDRISCTISDNNIFKATRTKERLSLIKVQKAILHSAFRTMSAKEGSATVYSTCSLSPVENDGVVMHTMKESEVPNLTIDLPGLINVLKPLERLSLFKLTRTRFGVLVEPNIVSNFGPMYVSRIVVQKEDLDTSVKSEDFNNQSFESDMTDPRRSRRRGNDSNDSQ